MVEDSSLFILIASLVVVAFLYLGIFVVLVRSKAINRRLWIHATALIISSIAMVLLLYHLLTATQAATVLIPGLCLLVSSAYIFFHVDNMGQTARRIRLLWELWASQGISTRTKLQCAYPPEEVVARRIERLKIANQLTQNQDATLIWQGGSFTMIRRILSIWGAALKLPK